ncbi:MAG TPA: hypothetical protein PKE31_21710 [Pseudomonadota bacterium]|nr:hypothetical protein [Pseudomonadota bacterium]
MPKLHDLLCKHLLREALDPISNVELEKPVAPLDEQRIDVYCELRSELPPIDALPHLGLVRRMAELERRCMIEPFSATPTAESIEEILRKKFNLHHGLKKAAKGEPSARPVLWVLSPGRSVDVIHGYVGLQAADWPRGFYCCAPELKMWIVVLAELPKTTETLLLRLLGSATMQCEALRELDALPLSLAQRQPWIDILGEVPNLTTEENTVMTELRQRWEREKAELRAESKAEALLTVLAARGLQVSEGVRERVLGCKDPRTLERWLTRAVTAVSASEAIAA